MPVYPSTAQHHFPVFQLEYSELHPESHRRNHFSFLDLQNALLIPRHFHTNMPLMHSEDVEERFFQIGHKLPSAPLTVQQSLSANQQMYLQSKWQHGL